MQPVAPPSTVAPIHLGTIEIRAGKMFATPPG
jgi:hypothetical protein